MVSVLGVGGIGKSALAVTLMRRVAEHFEVVLFRSLRDAPSCEAWLSDCLRVFSLQPLAEVPASLERRLSLLLEGLHERRALLVLDNLEALLQEGDIGGHYRPNFEGYGQVLQPVRRAAGQWRQRRNAPLVGGAEWGVCKDAPGSSGGGPIAQDQPLWPSTSQLR